MIILDDEVSCAQRVMNFKHTPIRKFTLVT